MPDFEVVRRTPLPAAEAWRRITDWKRHERYAPLTSVTLTTDPESGRECFVARTGIGPLAFDDPMTVTYVQEPTDSEPGVARLVKTGRAVLGWAVLTVTPLGDGSEVRWHESARMRGTGGPLAALVNIAVKAAFERLIAGVLED